MSLAVVRLFLTVLAVAPLASACVDTSPDRVKLTTRVEDPTLAIERGSLVTTLTGGFTLVLEVGDLASEDAIIQDPPTVQLVTADAQSSLHVLDALPAGAEFPLTLASGTDMPLAFSLTDRNTLPAADETRLCAAQVRYSVSLRDSLSDRVTSAQSDPVAPTGCP